MPVGLGPYRVVSWERGSRVVLEADPHFRRGPAKIPRVEIRIVVDSNTALTLWQSGEFDFYDVRGLAGSRSLLQGARTVKNAREYLSDHYQFNYLMFNTASGPLRDVRVRRALVRGIDGARIERLVRGELYRPGSGDRLPGQFAYDPSIVQASYDPVAAGKLLDTAGWRMHGGVRMRGGVPLALQIVGVANSTGSKNIDVQLQSALQALGIRVDVKDYQYNVLFGSAQSGGIFASGRFDISIAAIPARRTARTTAASAIRSSIARLQWNWVRAIRRCKPRPIVRCSAKSKRRAICSSSASIAKRSSRRPPYTASSRRYSDTTIGTSTAGGGRTSFSIRLRRDRERRTRSHACVRAEVTAPRRRGQ
jgi:ABC-type transport system substrate-binding protein